MVETLTLVVECAYALWAMGLIHVVVTLRPLEEAAELYRADFIVDTGATDSMAPASDLRRIGVTPVGRMTHELADGSAREYAFGLARIEFMGEITAGRVLFGPDDAEPLLGVTALESVGITVDPAGETLQRRPAIPLKSATAASALPRDTGSVGDHDLRAYARRPWHVRAAMKQEHWARELSSNPLATFEASQALWVHMRQINPDWPTEADRQEDLAHHIALKRAIDRAAGAFLAAAGR